MSAPSPIGLPHLYRHCLESILSFADLPELRCALMLSYDWYAAVHTMRPIAGTLRLSSMSAIPLASRSPLFRHVAHLLPGPSGFSDCVPSTCELHWGDLHPSDGALALFPALQSLLCFIRHDVPPAKSCGPGFVVSVDPALAGNRSRSAATAPLFHPFRLCARSHCEAESAATAHHS